MQKFFSLDISQMYRNGEAYWNENESWDLNAVIIIK